MVNCQEGCEDYSYFTFAHIIGTIFIALIAGLSSLAGLGGGGPSIVIYMACFNILPKDATIIVFSSILGSSFGNLVNQMRKALNNQPVIKYSYAFVSLPMMFVGSFIGIFMNKIMPSIVTVSIIIGVATHSLPKIFKRFKEGHERQTAQNLIRQEQDRKSDFLKETLINPFDSADNIIIFKTLALFVGFYATLSILRGSQKMPSIIGITSCSSLYWIFEICMFLLAISFYFHNKQALQEPSTIAETLFQKDTNLEDHKVQIIKQSIYAGIFSGFGLGGGIFLVPMYRNLHLSPLQATATCTFSIFITASINCLQAIFLGVLSLRQFLFFFLTASTGSFLISRIISNLFRKANRLSYIQLLLFLLLLLANINLPIGLYLKYIASNRNLNVIFGFGSPC